MNFRKNSLKRIGLGMIGILLVASMAISLVPFTEAKRLMLMSDEDFYRQQLGISTDVAVDKASVETFVERNQTDADNLNKVVYISRLMPLAIKRVVVSNDLLSMNRLFIRKFYLRAAQNEESKETLRQQITSYLENGEPARKIRSALTEERIKNLFSKRITSRQFITGLLQGQQN